MQKTRALVFILFIYICMQFSWWAYMLVDLNGEVYAHKIELIQFNSSNAAQKLQAENLLLKKLHSKWWMIAGEGFVFFTLLIFGIRKLQQAFSKEYELARSQKNFLLSVTHEFKSPLAAIKLNIQTIQKHKLDEEQRKRIIKSSLDETDRLNKLVEDTLIAAQIDTHTFSIQKEKMNLADCISDAMENRMMLAEKASKFNLDLDDDTWINGDYQSITSIVNNLVENAEKYSGTDAQIKITLHKKNREVELAVSDNGIGISDAEKENIFKKFYRVGNEDTRRTKGTGLGLYIVYQLAEMHSAKIEVKNNLPKGTVFKILFPIGGVV